MDAVQRLNGNGLLYILILYNSLRYSPPPFERLGYIIYLGDLLHMVRICGANNDFGLQVP
jgi:hypothetical protein